LAGRCPSKLQRAAENALVLEAHDIDSLRPTLRLWVDRIFQVKYPLTNLSFFTGSLQPRRRPNVGK
jgi:hypothetical protein